MARQIKIDPRWDALTQASVEASNLGISYGKLMAMRHQKEQTVRPEPVRDKALHHCKNCGVGLTGYRSGRARFCSAGCSYEYYSKHPDEEKEKYYCMQCGKELSGNRTSYCSEECKKAFYKSREEARVCVICGKAITTPLRRKFCSASCEDYYRLERKRELNRECYRRKTAKGAAV